MIAVVRQQLGRWAGWVNSAVGGLGLAKAGARRRSTAARSKPVRRPALTRSSGVAKPVNREAGPRMSAVGGLGPGVGAGSTRPWPCFQLEARGCRCSRGNRVLDPEGDLDRPDASGPGRAWRAAAGWMRRRASSASARSGGRSGRGGRPDGRRVGVGAAPGDHAAHRGVAGEQGEQGGVGAGQAAQSATSTRAEGGGVQTGTRGWPRPGVRGRRGRRARRRPVVLSCIRRASRRQNQSARSKAPWREGATRR